MKFLKLLFGKKDADYSKLRLGFGAQAGLAGVFSNSLLFALKLAAGLIGGSVTVVADAINNLSDGGVSAVTYAGFKLAKRPADREHPYGHARYEYIAGLIAAFTIVGAGIISLAISVRELLSPGDIVVGAFTYAVLGFSVIVKTGQAFMYFQAGRRLESATLKAAGTDALNDILATLMAFVVVYVYDTTAQNFDGFFGIFISLYVMFSGVRLVKKTADPLIGSSPDKDLVKKSPIK